MMSSQASGSTPPSAPPGPDSRIESLDAFRGLCALTVFLTHWIVWANFPPVGETGRLLHDGLATAYQMFGTIIWNTDGQHPAVLAFFVLSGFCIHTARARRAATVVTASEWRRYFISRGRRILPVYWWGTFLGVGLVALQATWPSANPLFAPQVVGGLRDLLVRVFAVTAVVPGDVILGNWSLNTVSSEIAIYALYPLLFVGTRRLGWMPLLVALIALQFAGLALLPYVPVHWLFGSPLLMGAYWYLGLLAAEWHFKGGRPVPGWAVLLAWGLFLALRGLPFSPANYVLIQLVRALGFALLLLWLVGRESRDPSFVRSGPLRWLRPVGQVSYSLYAVHPPVIMATTWALGFLPGYRSHAFQLLLTLVVPLLVTGLTYWLVERPYLLSAKAAPAPKTV